MLTNDSLTKQIILSTLWDVKQDEIVLDVFQSIDSTNTYLRENFRGDKIHLCLAQTQTAGRGRQGKKWHSPPDQNLYLSIAYRTPHSAKHLQTLSLSVGLIIIDALEIMGLRENAKLKWPNDIMVDNKKLAGILIEVMNVRQDSSDVIIGLGLNVNMQEANDISQAWISLRQIQGKTINRNDLASKLISKLIPFLKTNNYAIDMAGWQKVDYLFNQKIKINHNKNIIHGIMRGINPEGQLLLKTEDGVIPFSSGDIHILK